MPTVKLSVLMGYECNNRCIFCYDGAGYKRGRVLPLTTKEIKDLLVRGRKNGCNMVDFLGGEPTIRKDLPELIAYAKELGYNEIAITTNGQMLSYKEYAKKLIDAGLNHLIVSIHSCKPEVHDFLTQNKGSWERAVKGVKNVREIKPDIFLANNLVITKYNYDHMDETLRFLVEDLKINSIEFIYPHPKGRAYVYYDEVVPSLQEIQFFVRKTLEKARELKEKYPNILKHFAFRYLPLCYIYPYLEFSSEYFAQKIDFQEKHVGPEFEDWNVELGRIMYGKVKGEQCKRCILKDVCEGLWKEHAEIRGTRELIPILNEDELLKEAITRKYPITEIIQVLYGLKRAWVYEVNEEGPIVIHNIGVRTGSYAIFDWMFSKRIFAVGDIHVVPELSREYSKTGKERDNIKIGKLLGYPQCCIEFHSKWLKLRNEKGELYANFEIFKNSKKYHWELNFFYNFQTRIKEEDEYEILREYISLNKDIEDVLSSLYLVSWIPHSFDCSESLKIAQNTFRILSEKLPDFAIKLKEILSRPVLFLDKWEWYTLDLEVIKDENEYIKAKINRVVPPYAPYQRSDLSNKTVIAYKDRPIVEIDKEEMEGFLVVFQ